MKYNKEVIRETIRINIKKYRKANNLTQKELAKLSGVASPSVSNWEKGHCTPDIETLFLICNVFKIDINEMLGVSNDPDINLTPIEKELIYSYRKADDIGKQLIERCAGIEGQQEQAKNIV